eukprot:maker-scaffold487_size158652-snap-gene-0.37 protein:Tk00179 transcript:maker-scaffold487_size158652-snap-gene-0.37-mRNA-1 annotation:"solute carrier family 12 member 1-like isoform 2"
MQLVVVHGEEGQEGHENGAGTQKVPRVVGVVKVEVSAVFVDVPRLGRREVPVGRAIQIEGDGQDSADEGQDGKYEPARDEDGNPMPGTHGVGIEVHGIHLVLTPVAPHGLGHGRAEHLVLPEDVVADVEEEIPGQDGQYHVGDGLVRLQHFGHDQVDDVGKVDEAEHDGEAEALRVANAHPLPAGTRSPGLVEHILDEHQSNLGVQPGHADEVAVHGDEHNHQTVDGEEE